MSPGQLQAPVLTASTSWCKEQGWGVHALWLTEECLDRTTSPNLFSSKEGEGVGYVGMDQDPGCQLHLFTLWSYVVTWLAAGHPCLSAVLSNCRLDLSMLSRACQVSVLLPDADAVNL